MLVCYLDDSGQANEPIITLAGLIGTADCWLEFESNARALFNELGLCWLHTVELHHRRGQFKGWSTAETTDFADTFFRLVERYVGFSVEFSVLKSRFNEAKKRYGLKRETSAMSMCFRGVLDRIVKDPGFREAEKVLGINLSFVVESGHPNNQDVLQRFNEIKKMDPSRFGSLVFEDKKKRIALQAADFIAFYSRRIRNRTLKNPRTDEVEMFQRVLGNINIGHSWLPISALSQKTINGLRKRLALSINARLSSGLLEPLRLLSLCHLLSIDRPRTCTSISATRR